MDMVHGTLVKLSAGAALLRGPSGCGKSDLASRLIDRGGILVADDQVALQIVGDRLTGAAPDTLAGLLELRGIGIVEYPYQRESNIDLVVELVPAAEIVRLPTETCCEILGHRLPSVQVAPFEASAPLKVEMMMKSILQS